VFVLRPTQKLAKILGLLVPATTPEVRNYVADWCVQDFKVGRIRYLLFVNTASLLPVIVHARGANELSTLMSVFAEGLKLTFEGTPWTAQLQRWILPELSNVQLGRIPGRSLLGSTNDFIRMACFHLQEGDSLEQTSRSLAKAPMGYLGMNSPDRVFPKLRGRE
jgi:hypothetical protein